MSTTQLESTVPDAALPELDFVHPIPGFSGLRRFVLVRLDEEDNGTEGALRGPLDDAGERSSMLYELRSVDRADVRFMVAAPSAFFSGYEIELADEDCGDLGLASPGDALVLVMLTVGADAASTTANLLAPVVVNARTRAAAQVILTGSDWPVRAPLG
jgi:flagellar assembly factor FliW